MVRDFLNIFSPVGVLLLLGFAVVLILCMAVAFVKLRFRRKFSLGCAAVAIPLVLVTVLRLAVFSPYYWYVLLNQSRFESEAKSETQSGLPTFAKLEGRDVSVGLAISPPTFTSIVYDESDELGLGPAKRSAEWNARNGTHLSMDGGGAPMIYTARHLHGHFYLVSSTYP